MLDEDERTAWEDAYRAAHKPPREPDQRSTGWFGTAGSIAAGLIALWALHAWAPG